MSIDVVVLSGIIVKTYSSKTVELLSHMRTILDTLSGIRLELDRNFRSKREPKLCRKCRFDPRRLLDELQVAFLTSLTEFLALLRILLEESIEDASAKCDMCLARTRSDALVALEQAMTLRRFALKEGLGIVEV